MINPIILFCIIERQGLIFLVKIEKGERTMIIYDEEKEAEFDFDWLTREDY